MSLRPPRRRGPSAPFRVFTSSSVLLLTVVALAGCAQPQGFADGSSPPPKRPGSPIDFLQGKSTPKIKTPQTADVRFVAAQPQAAGRGECERVHEPGKEQPEMNLFVARCRDIERFKVKQIHGQWCWAACAEMVLKYEGVDRNAEQMDIAGRFGSADTQQAAGTKTLMLAMNPDLEPQLKGKFFFGPGLTRQTSTALVEEILQGRPVVMGIRESPDDLEGHVFLAYEVKFRQVAPKKLFGVLESSTAGPEYAIEEVKLIDPKKDDPITRAGEDLRMTADFLVSRDMARTQLVDMITRAQQSEAARPARSGDGKNYTLKDLFD